MTYYGGRSRERCCGDSQYVNATRIDLNLHGYNKMDVRGGILTQLLYFYTFSRLHDGSQSEKSADCTCGS